MLSHLIIRNFAIIDHLEIALQPGFTVLTGETGAGKSIVIDALNLILGGRASTSVIRTNREEAIVEASFHLTPLLQVEISEILEELSIDHSDNQLTIRRIISRSGRNKVIVNGSITNVTTLQRLTKHLVDISGQHEHYSLINEAEHLPIVDRFGQIQEEKELYAAAYAKVRNLRNELKILMKQDDNRLQRVDFIKFQLSELVQAELELGEEERLNEEYQRLKNAEKIASSVGLASTLLSDSSSSAALAVTEAIDSLTSASHYVSDVDPLIKRLKEVLITLHDVSHELNTTYRMDADPHRLDQVQSRLELLKRLRRKHNRDIDELIKYTEELTLELDHIENNEAHQERVRAELARAERGAIEAALSLSKTREGVAKKLAKLVMENLAELNMARSVFVIENDVPVPTYDVNHPQFEELYKEQIAKMLSPLGVDTLTFRIAPNLGEDPKPIAKIASGGELSRIMLAIKTILADQDNFSTYIFDEVDTGLSGETADRMGEMILATSKDHQVLCITHLPQIASRANHHLLVAKHVENDRTVSTITPLTTDGQVEEIARMLGGTRVTEKTLEAARELIGAGA